MNYFYELNYPEDYIAVITPKEGIITYGELRRLCDSVSDKFEQKLKGLVLILCSNTYESLCGYLSCLRRDYVPLLLDSKIEAELLMLIIRAYEPDYIWGPKKSIPSDFCYEIFSMGRYILMRGFENKRGIKLNQKLTLLLSTSGSTGSPKLVRLSKTNIQSNADAICEYLNITSRERTATVLPMQYTYGLSIINSHLNKGATILLTDSSVMQNEFWNFAKSNALSSLSGVPYTYQMYKRLKIFNMNIPTLKIMTQAGGKLPADLGKEFSENCAANNIKFFIMYGATEATARMSYLPPEKVIEKYTSIGVPIPGGKFRIMGDNGQEITSPETEGELVYIGPNVMLGYAESAADLNKEDEMGSELYTGDIAKFDNEGYYYIVGRKKRFIKLFGNRVSLDEVERILKTRGYECTCIGNDEKLMVFSTQEGLDNEISNVLSNTLHINSVAFKVIYLSEIPRSEAGKPLYSKLREVLNNV